MMVSVAGEDETLPQGSLNHTDTVLSPAPPANVHVVVVAYVFHAVHEVVLLRHICATPLASVAESANVTVVLFAHVAPPLMTTLPPVGPANSGAGTDFTIAPVDMFPATSFAHTRKPYVAPLVRPVATYVVPATSDVNTVPLLQLLGAVVGATTTV
jgi:hypothetical protein